MCEKSAGMDNECKRGVSVYVAGNEFFAGRILKFQTLFGKDYLQED
jgi:hypothetical protein